METLWWLLAQIVWLIWSVLSWLVGHLLWLAFWVLAPVILIAIVAVRVAEYVLGREVVRAWVKRHLAQVRCRHLAAHPPRPVRARRDADPRAGLADPLQPMARPHQPVLDAPVESLGPGLAPPLAKAARLSGYAARLLVEPALGEAEQALRQEDDHQDEDHAERDQVGELSICGRSKVARSRGTGARRPRAGRGRSRRRRSARPACRCRP